jgi:UDP-glucuronate 4-epimerase
MALLVTGVAGFIGSSVANALLDRGEQVIGIDNLNDYYDPALKRARLERLATAHGNAFSFEGIDFGDQEALEAFAAPHRFDRIIHLGAQAGVRYSLINPQAYVRSNLMGQINMLELARHRAVGHFVYASSSSVYGGNKELPFRVEDRVDHPVSLYAATKKSDELMSESYAHLFRVPMTGLRFFTVYGPWGRPDMAMWIFTKALYEGRPLTIFNGGDMRRDFTFIDDIVSGVLACLDGPPADDGQKKAGGSSGPHALYNIGNHRSEELMRMVGLLEQATGRTAAFDFQPMQAGDVKDTFADISAIQRDHGFEPSTSIDEGVPRFVDWFKQYHRID